MPEIERPIGVAIIVLQKNKILMGKRLGGYKPGTMGLPGGRIERKEGILEALSRELHEEVGIVPKEFNFVGVVRNDQRDSVFVHFVYSCTKYTGKPQNKEPDKCEGWDWYFLNKLPDNVLPGHKTAINLYLSGEIIGDMY